MHLQCSHCDRTFTKTEHLRRHERAHTKEKPFGCHVCKKAYARSDVLARHMRMHQRKEEGGSEHSSPLMHNGQHTPSTAPYPVLSSTTAHTTATKGRQNGHDKHASADYSSLDSLQRYNMTAMNGAAGSFASPRQYYTNFSTQPPGYTQPPTPTDFMPSNTSTNGSVPAYVGLSTYPSTSAYPTPTGAYSHDRYNTSLNEADLRTSPIQYQNFPPVSQDMDQEIDLAPAPFPNPTAVWQNQIKDATESNVRASGIQGYAATAAANVQSHQNEYAMNGYMAKSQPQLGVAQSPMVGNDLHKWLKVNQHHNPVNSILMLGNSRPSIDMGYSTPNSMPGFPKGPEMTPLQEDGQGRYPKVEQSWYKRQSNQGRSVGAEKHWYDILHGMRGDLFNSQTPSCPVPADGFRVRVSEECRMRMIHAVYAPVTNVFNPASLAYTKEDNRLEQVYARFPSCSAFDDALHKYFESFLREAPFFHMSVFSISTCHPLLLFVMSCIGFGLQKTPEGCRFVQANFISVRDRILTELEKNLASTVKDAMSIFATAFVFLKLAALIVDRDHLSPCQLLYVSLLSLAQMHGMFSYYGKRTTPDLYNSFSSVEEKWMAWGRVESLKRISVSLLRLDSAYATFLKSAPILKVNTIELPLPCDDRLFEASTAEEWYSLVQNEQLPTIMPAMTLTNSLDKLVGCTYLNYYSLHAVLNYLQVRSLDAYQKLLEFQHTQSPDTFVVVPFQFYRTDPSLENMTLHIVAFIDSYENLLPRYAADWQRTNCLVFWHFLCLSLTMNQDLFEIAVGREGPQSAARSISSIESWSKTTAARRALIHSASIYQLLSEKKSSEMSSLYAAFGTFAAALVMTMFVFANPAGGQDVQQQQQQPQQQQHAGSLPAAPVATYELTSEVHWQNFGLAGLDENISAVTGSAAETFVLRGGSYTFKGRTLIGFEGAQYILKDYADLLKVCGRYNYKDMCRVLLMMNQLLQSSNEQ